MNTPVTKGKDIQRAWHHVDVQGKILGRVAVEIAGKLLGKTKPYFVRNLECGDYVVVTHAKSVVVTGNKEKEKKYSRYSGYPGGLRVETVEEVRKRKPEELIRHAVFGMLPKNKLRDSMIKRLYSYADNIHPYKEKLTT